MNLPAALTVPVEHRSDVGLYLAMLACLAIGAVTSFLYRGVTITHTVTHNQSINEQYGKPSSVIPGEQVNAGLKGATCDLYSGRKTLICHP